MERLHILDGHNYVYRAYFGLMGPGGTRLSTKAGMPTGALYVYASMLLRLYLDENPDRIVVVFDAPGPSFRKDLDEDYKATRRPMPDDLRLQMPYFRPITEAFSWPVLSIEGVEADDVIATLARQGRERGWDVVIYSRDKDLMQLLDSGTRIVDAMEDVIYDADRVKAKYGVGPDQLGDWLALVGDASDNVPGMAGVGKKGATKLLEEFGSIDGILAHTDKLKGKMKERFEDPEHLERLRLSQKLVRLVDDVDIGTDLDALHRGEWDGTRLKELLRELEFEALIERLEPGAGATKPAEPVEAPPAVEPPVAMAEPADLAALLDGATRVAIQVETDAQRPVRADVVGVGIAVPGKPPAYVPIAHRYLSVPAQMSAADFAATAGAVLADPSVEVVCHDAKATETFLSRMGLILAGVACDTMLAAYLIDASSDAYELPQVLATYAGTTIRARTDLTGKGKKARGFDAVAVEQATEYAGTAAGALLRAADVLAARLEADGLADLHRDVEVPLAHLLSRVERTGVRIDIAHLRAMADKVSRDIAALETQAHELAGDVINLGSPKQLAALLFDKLQLTSPRMKKTKTGYSTDYEVLDAMRGMHPIIDTILEHRELVKLKGTYIDALPPLVNPETGRVHTSFRQAVAATGRLSSSDPNLQNIPVRTELGREIRRAFVPAEGYRLVSCDYSQIELRLLAHYCEDPVLVSAFRDGVDIHTQTAAEVFEMPLAEVGARERRVAKAVNYGLIYGQSGFGLSRALDIPRGEAQQYIERYFARFTKVESFLARIIEDARRTGVSTTILGRRRPIPELASRNFRVRSGAERIARNTPLQGSGADILKLAMLGVQKLIDTDALDAKMVLTVHDELVFEVAAGVAEDVGNRMKRAMESVYPLRVPLVVDVGIADNWAEAH